MKRSLARSLTRSLLFAAAASLAPATARAGDILVGLLGDADPAALARDTGTVLVEAVPGRPFALLRPAGPVGPVETKALLALIEAHPDARYAELDAVAALPEVGGCGYAGNPGIQQCTLGFVDGSTAPGPLGSQAWMRTIHLDPAQQLSNGRPSLVAVLDTGIDAAHPLFAGRIDPAARDFVLDQPGAAEVLDGIDDDGDGWVDEGFGHGTHVAGIVVLVNPDATLLPLRVMDSDGNGSAWDVADAIFYAMTHGADVLNLSVSFLVPSQAVADALHLAVTSGMEVFTSAGNTAGPLVLFPGNLPTDADTQVPLPPIYPHGVACVAAVDAPGHLAPFSAFGPAVDLCAPGLAIRSAWPGGVYATWSGTSMSCAVASGVASLCHSARRPGPPPPTVERMILTAVPLSCEHPTHLGAVGAGVVDALAAVESALGL